MSTIPLTERQERTILKELTDRRARRDFNRARKRAAERHLAGLSAVVKSDDMAISALASLLAEGELSVMIANGRAVHYSKLPTKGPTSTTVEFDDHGGLVIESDECDVNNVPDVPAEEI